MALFFFEKEKNEMKKNLELKIYNPNFKIKNKEVLNYFTNGHTGYFGNDPGVRYRISLGEQTKYVASVIKKVGSYGYEQDKWEIALINELTNSLVTLDDFFDEMGDDVIGYLDEEDVNDWLDIFYEKVVIKMCPDEKLTKTTIYDQFLFDESNMLYDLNPEYNLTNIKYIIRGIKDIFKCRGYIYMNQIYEMFDHKWDVNQENVLINDEVGDVLTLSYKECSGAYIIKIKIEKGVTE